MIRRLEETDRQSVLEYLYQDSSINIFIIGDIEHFGFDKEWQTLWAEFDDQGVYQSVLLLYYDSLIYYSHKNEIHDDYIPLISKLKFNIVSGKESLVNLIEPFLVGFKRKEMYFCKADTLENPSQYDSNLIKLAATKKDCEKLYNSLSQIKEFGIEEQPKAEFIERKLNSIAMGDTLFIEKDGEILSTVTATAETTVSAMVVAVATLPQARGNGYASILMEELMKKYFYTKKKELCLFYDNPKAGKIYLRLGFKDIGKWLTLEKK